MSLQLPAYFGLAHMPGDIFRGNRAHNREFEGYTLFAIDRLAGLVFRPFGSFNVQTLCRQMTELQPADYVGLDMWYQAGDYEHGGITITLIRVIDEEFIHVEGVIQQGVREWIDRTVKTDGEAVVIHKAYRSSLRDGCVKFAE